MTEASVPGEGAAIDDAAATRPATPPWLAAVIAVAFGIFYAYDVWEAVGNLVGLNIYAGELDIAFTASGIALLIVAIAAPLVVYAAAFWIGRRRNPMASVMLFLVGYALVQVLTADVAALFDLGGFDLPESGVTQ